MPSSNRIVHNAYRFELEGPRSMREPNPNGEVVGGVEWQARERRPEMSALICVPRAPVGQQALPRAPLRLALT